MTFDTMPPEDLQEYLAMIPKRDTASIILTDGTTLTGRYVKDALPLRPILEALDEHHLYRVIVPSSRIAGVLEHSTTNPTGIGPSPPALLVDAAIRSGLDVSKVEYFAEIEFTGDWRMSETIYFGVDTVLYLDASSMQSRMGGINGIGGGFLASASVNWSQKMVSKVKRLLKHHVVEVGSQCGAPRSDMTMMGYVEFFDVSNLEPSSDSGPLLLLEGARWIGAVVRQTPPGARSPDEPWALCYFQEDHLGLGPRNWERIGQPVRIYGDKLSQPQNTNLGIAPCYLKVRAAACFGTDH
jgi:hypothetical protein